MYFLLKMGIFRCHVGFQWCNSSNPSRFFQKVLKMHDTDQTPLYSYGHSVWNKDILLMEEILHQLIGSLSHYLKGFAHSRWCRISSINSSTFNRICFGIAPQCGVGEVVYTVALTVECRLTKRLSELASINGNAKHLRNSKSPQICIVWISPING